MRPARRSLVALALPGLFVACDPGRSVVPGPNDLALAVREVHRLGNVEVAEPVMTLFLNTERTYGCFNYALDAAPELQEQSITVRVGGVLEPVVCLAAIGPATYQTALQVAEGEYTLRVEREEQVDQYVLVVTEATVELRAQSARFTRAAPARAWRFPRRSFAAVCDAADGGTARCEEFRAALQAAAPFTRFDFGDGGEIPYPQSFSQHGLDWRVNYYRYATEEDFVRAGTVVQSLAARYPGALLYVVNWRNEAHRSWRVGS